MERASPPLARPKPRGRFRRASIQIHLWLGITIGLLWALQGLTGALLVFHREADRIGGAALTDAPMLPIGRLIDTAEAIAHHPLQRLTAVSNDPRLVEARFLDDHHHVMAVQLDAATGRLTGRRDRDPGSPFTGSAWRWIYLLHISLVAGVTGRALIGISGLILATGTALGLYIGWPGLRWRQWRAAFEARRWKIAIQKLYGWHRATGLAAGAAVLVMALTGAYMTFNAALAPMIARWVRFDPSATMAHMPVHMSGMEGMVHISPDAAMAIARRRFPVGRFMNFELPSEHPAYYSVRFTLPSEIRRWSGRAMVRIDPADGAVLAVYDPRSAPIANHVDDAIYPIHLGEAGGLPGRLLVFCAGLSLPVLYVTGLLRWLRRRR